MIQPGFIEKLPFEKTEKAYLEVFSPALFVGSLSPSIPSHEPMGVMREEQQEG